MANPASSTSLAGLAVLLLPIVLLLSFFTSLHAAQGAMAGLAGGGGARSRRAPPAGYVPVRAVVYRSVAIPLPAATTASADEAPGGGGGGGGGYEPFELCMGCRCCAAAASGNSNGSSSSCLDTQCCYAIDCNIPGKPFGVCAFSPHTCGCAGNNNCTTSS